MVSHYTTRIDAIPHEFPPAAHGMIFVLSSLVVGSLLQPTVRPRLAGRLRMTSSEAQDVDPPKVKANWLPAYTVPEPGGRYPYTLTDLPRPVWRGRMMGWLHRTRLWYLFAVVYVALAVRVVKTPLDVGLRVAAAIATSANIFISDGYHNGDKRGTRRRNEAYDPTVERRWLKWDYVGISAILTTQYWLWASNFGWVARLKLGAWLSGAALIVVIAVSQLVVPRKAGHTTVKAVMGLQFVGLLGYLVSMGCYVGPSARLNTLVFAAYSPGLVCYVLKKPKSSAPPRCPKSGHGSHSSLGRLGLGMAGVRGSRSARRRPAPLRAASQPHALSAAPCTGVWLPRDLPHERDPGAQHQHDLRSALGAAALGPRHVVAFAPCWHQDRRHLSFLFAVGIGERFDCRQCYFQASARLPVGTLDTRRGIYSGTSPGNLPGLKPYPYLYIFKALPRKSHRYIPSFVLY